MAIPHMSFEPGRSISGPSGATLYTVGTIKNVSIEDENGEIRVRRYVSVDGGMSDNARPVLYESDYSVTWRSCPGGEQVLSRVWVSTASPAMWWFATATCLLTCRLAIFWRFRRRRVLLCAGFEL